MPFNSIVSVRTMSRRCPSPARTVASLRVLLVASVALAASSQDPVRSPTGVHAEGGGAGWSLAWSDEFEGAAGSPPNPASWRLETGDGCAAGICGWGNNEKQRYTTDPANASHTGSGALAITARVAPAGLSCYYGPCRYTSAKLTTKGLVEPKYGRVEARIKLPHGQGLWPAFWMLGADFPSTPWPASGEIDIMEFRGSRPGEMSSAMHGPGYSGDKTPFVNRFAYPPHARSDDFHRYAAEWEPGQVRFYVDEVLHYTVHRSAPGALGNWAFDHAFYVILNMAVGGGFDGDPASDAILPATMLVDYVRVYEREARAGE